MEMFFGRYKWQVYVSYSKYSDNIVENIVNEMITL